MMIIKNKNTALYLMACVTLVIGFLMANHSTINAQDDFSINGFIDEDGDGFNDLLPDSDGDGVPDPLDPDFKGNHTDSSYMQHYLQSHGGEHQLMWQNMHENMMGDMMDHGESGMFGPGDSTMHGGHDGGGMGPGGGGGMGPGGGGGGGMGGPGPDGNFDDPIIPLPDENKVNVEKLDSGN